uniref:ADP ribosylation factor like GTPase 17B n=1 Tax=Homo sapiens TaxID=9606 RepID=A0A994J5L7_HUMAN
MLAATSKSDLCGSIFSRTQKVPEAQEAHIKAHLPAGCCQ